MFKNIKNLFLQSKKYSPEILVGAGILGGLTSTILACKATLDAKEVVDNHKEKVTEIEQHKQENGQVLDDGHLVAYSQEEAKKDLINVYTNTGVELVKLYAPSVLLMSSSIGAILGSHKILYGRYAAMSAAYATVDQAFKKYRAEVVEKYGDDTDKELKFGIKAEKADPNNKDQKTYKMTAKTPDQPSAYARFFDETNLCWEDDPEYNLMFLKQRQNWANDRLKSKGILFLNEVYESIGIPQTKAGNIVGWIYDPDNSEIDSYVDFGIYDVKNSAKREFVNGVEKAILLDFNVDGNVLDLLK